MKEKNIDNFECNSYFLQKIHSDFFRQIINQTSLEEDKIEKIINNIMQKVFQDKISKKEIKKQSKQYFMEKTEDLIDFLYDIGGLEDKEGINHSNKYNYNKTKKILSQIVNPNINKQKIIGRTDKILQKKKHRNSRSKSEERLINNNKYNENKLDHHNYFIKKKQVKYSNRSNSSNKLINLHSKSIKHEKQPIKPYISLDNVLKPRIELKKVLNEIKEIKNDNNKSNKEDDNENTFIKGEDKKIITQINNNTFNVTTNKCNTEIINIENSLINKKEIINDEKNNQKKEIQNNGVKYKIKCKKWPYCKDQKCEYIHPDKPCPFFPNCLYGKRCIYIHPYIPCKFGIYCTRINCAYSHPGFNYPTIC